MVGWQLQPAVGCRQLRTCSSLLTCVLAVSYVQNDAVLMRRQVLLLSVTVFCVSAGWRSTGIRNLTKTPGSEALAPQPVIP